LRRKPFSPRSAATIAAPSEVAPVGADEITMLAALKVVFETWALL
jgi:hypothetical protein